MNWLVNYITVISVPPSWDLPVSFFLYYSRKIHSNCSERRRSWERLPEIHENQSWKVIAYLRTPKWPFSTFDFRFFFFFRLNRKKNLNNVTIGSNYRGSRMGAWGAWAGRKSSLFPPEVSQDCDTQNDPLQAPQTLGAHSIPKSCITKSKSFARHRQRVQLWHALLDGGSEHNHESFQLMSRRNKGSQH